MRVTIIGYWGGFPRAGEASSGYLVEHDGYKLLLECGSGVLSSVQKISDIKDINAALITHYHYDHCCDIGPLQYGVQVKTQLKEISAPLPIYGPDGEFFELLKWGEYTYGVRFDEKSSLTLGPFEVSFIKNVHPVDTYGVRIKCGGKVFSYSSDTSYFEDLVEFYKGSDLLICECSFYSNMDGTKAGHLNSSQAGMLAEKAGVKKLVLTHLPHFGDLNNLLLEARDYYKGKIELASFLKEIKIYTQEVKP